tara:strand:+ start:26760 stop:33266 length:6507 start_codon:yes stop_codon:yes gene_type:complete
MANSKFLELQDTDNSNLIDKCDELTAVPSENVCVRCKKDPNYTPPDWKARNVDEPWLNERNCKYFITINTNEKSVTPSASATDAEISEFMERMFQTYMTEAIDGILAFYEKENSDDNIDSLRDKTTVEKYDLDIRIHSRVQLLYSIAFEDVALIPDAPERPSDEEEEDEAEEEDSDAADITVAYQVDELTENLLKVRKGLHLYANYLKIYRLTQKGNLIKVNDNSVFNLKRYGDNGFEGTGVLERIIKDIDRFLHDRGYKIRGGFVNVLQGMGQQIVDNIEFTFSKDYELKKMVITTFQCGEKRIVFKKKLHPLLRKGHFKDKTAMAYLSKVDEMANDLMAREPMPWLEFVISHTYPELVETFNWPIDSPVNEETTKSCIGEALLSEMKQVGSDILDIDFGLHDAILMLFNNEACKTNLAEVHDDEVKLNLVYDPQFRDPKTMWATAKAQAFEQIENEGGAFLTACMSLFGEEADSGGGSEAAKQKTGRFLDRIKLCGLTDMGVEAIKCLMGGLSFEEAVGKILKATIRNMSLENFGEFFELLSPEQQMRLEAHARNNMESGTGIFKDGSNNQRINAYIEAGEGTSEITDFRPWSNRRGMKERIEAGDASRDKVSKWGTRGSEIGAIEEHANPHPSTGTLAQSYLGPPNVVDSSTFGLLMELYAEAIIDVFQDDLLNIVQLLNRFPGAQILARSLMLLDCPKPPLFEPSVLDFIKDRELPFCGGMKDITLPQFQNPMAWVPVRKDIWSAIKVAFKLALQKVLVAVITRIITKICNLLGTTLCTALKTTGQLVAAAANPNDPRAIEDIIRDTICDADASDETVKDTLMDMFSKLGLGAAAMADTEKLMNFSNDLSNSLTRAEMMGAFLGKPTNEALTVMDNLIENEYPEYRDALPNKDALADFTNGIGNLLPADYRSAMNDFVDQLPPDDAFPANPSLCATPQDFENFCNLREGLLQGRASPGQARAMAEQYCEGLGDELEDIADLLQKGPQKAMADAMPQLISDPGCDNGIIPFQPEGATTAANQALGRMMKQLHLKFSMDMIGNGPGERNWGMMNMIMSDTMGNPLTAHNRKAYFNKAYVNFLVDDADAGDEDDVANFRKEGQFPYKVAGWLQEQLSTMMPIIETHNDFTEDTYINKTFEELGLSLYGGVSAIELPEFGYRTVAWIDNEQEAVTFVRLGRKKTPDLTLSFYDNNRGRAEGDASMYSEAFDVDLFLGDLVEANVGEATLIRNIPADASRINVVVRLNQNADGAEPLEEGMTRDQRKEMKKRGRDPSIIVDRAYEFLAVDDEFSNLQALSEYTNFQRCFTTQTEHTPQLTLFHEILTQNGRSVTIGGLKSVYDNLLTVMMSDFISKVANNEEAFLYGAKFDELTREDAAYVVKDDQTDSPGGTPYGEATIDGEIITNDNMILGVSYDQYINDSLGTPENTRVFYLNPADYGGKYINPPIHVKPMVGEGWMGIIDVVFPEISPCKPTRTDLIDFQDIEDEIQETYRNLPEDKRLQHDPDCVRELPYNRVLERMSVAKIQGIIKAACRIYSSAHFIKTLATFTTFAPDFDKVFSSIYPQYIVEVMEESFKDAQPDGWERLSTFKDEEFWYAFLEQSVQAYGRLLDEGKIEDPPESVLRALEELNNVQSSYDFPSRDDWLKAQDVAGDVGKSLAAGAAAAAIPVPGSAVVAGTAVAISQWKTYKQYKEELNFEAIKSSEEQAKIVLKEWVKTELQNTSARFIENLKDLGVEPEVRDIDYYFLETFTQGGINLNLNQEIVEIEEDYPSGPSHGQTSNNLGHTHVYYVDEDGNGWAYEASNPTEPRIRHKHEIINWVVQPASSDCYPKCKEVFEGPAGLGPHDHSITNLIVPIGDVESYDYTPATNSSAPFVIEKYISIDGTKYSIERGTEIIKSRDPTLNISDIYPGTLELTYEADPNTGEPIPSGLTGELGVRHGLLFSYYEAYEKTPITSVEIDALDYETQAFVGVQGDSKELLCLINLLKQDETFRLITRYIFPSKKLLSTLAIYNDMGFLRSIGEITVADGDAAGIDSTFASKPGSKVTFDDDGNLSYEESIVGWASADDREPGMFSGWFIREWDNWDAQILGKSNVKLKRMFKRAYNSRDWKFNLDLMFSFNPTGFWINRLKNLMRPRPGQALVPRWRRRKLRRNPFDANGKLCKKDQ